MLQNLLAGFLKLAQKPSRNIFTTMPVLHDVDVPTSKATFALRCFWGPDAKFGVVKGVIRTRVGYTGGDFKDPTYHNLGDTTEAIDIDYDPKTINFQQLLDLFWSFHDPSEKTTKQYASIIFYHDEEQKALAETSLEKQLKAAKAEGRAVTTTLRAANEFYNAEDYHQKYSLQKYGDIMSAIGLSNNSKKLTSSHVAARLNGYVAGKGSVKQLEEESEGLGLGEQLTDHLREIMKKQKGCNC